MLVKKAQKNKGQHRILTAESNATQQGHSPRDGVLQVVQVLVGL